MCAPTSIKAQLEEEKTYETTLAAPKKNDLEELEG